LVSFGEEFDPMARPFRYRDAILALLERNPIHPTADSLHGELRKIHPRVSLATVYRTLRVLAAEGILCELPFGEGGSRFGLALEGTHYHFLCEVCRRIFDLPLPPEEGLEEAVRSRTGHEVARHTVEFYGRCRECAEAATKRNPKGRRPSPGRTA
jgi:Fur family peroxide stress response transcriptional regulator